MAINPKPRKLRRRNDSQKERSVKGVAARRTLREVRAGEAVTRVVGTVTFDGPYFGGPHRVAVSEVSDGRPVFDLSVDGSLTGIRSERGVRSLIARMIAGTP